MICAAVTLNKDSQQILEKKYNTVEEELPYNIDFIPFREGPVVVDILKGLKIEPELIMILGDGAIHKNKLGLASYVGIILNKPSIGVSKRLLNGVLKEDNIYFKEDSLGNPTYKIYSLKTI